MPLQYRIEYRWPDKVKGTRKASRGTVKKRVNVDSDKRETMKTYAETLSSTESRSQEGRSAKTRLSGKTRTTTSRPVLEKVVLPAGYCVYYARGSGAPLMQWDPQQGRISKSTSKELGVVDPACSTHNIVEEEYAIIREVLEICLERQVSDGTDGDRYRVGGQLEDEEQLLEQLAQFMPDVEGIQNSTRTSLVPYEPQKPNTDTDITRGNASKPAGAAKTGRRNILPISKSLQANASPRGLFLVEGQAVWDTGKESDSTEAPGGETAGAGPDGDTVKGSEEGGLLTVARKPLSSRVDDRKKREELDRSFEFLRTVHQRYVDPKLRQRRGKGSTRFGRRFVRNVPLLLVYQKPPMEVRGKNKSRSNAGMTPETIARPNSKIPLNAKPPSPTFQLRERPGQGGDKASNWKPRVSQRGVDIDFNPDLVAHAPKSFKPLQTEGRSFVTKTPTKVILNVVLPREDKSREGRPGRHMSGDNERGRHPQHLQAWLSRVTSPPPPSPPSAPTHQEPADDLVIHQYNSDDEDDVNDQDDDDNQDDDDDQDSGRPGSFHSADSFRLTATGSYLANKEQDASPSQFVASQMETPKQDEPENTQLNTMKERETRVPKSTDSDPTVAEMTLASNVSTVLKHSSKASPGKTAGNSVTTTSRQNPVPGLNLGPRMVTAEYTVLSARGQSQDQAREATSTSARSHDTHCEVFGPALCALCEETRQRQQFTTRQEILYPRISVSPRHMVATQRIKAGRGRGKTDGRKGQGWSSVSSTPRWPFVSVGHLNDVVTDLDLCKRVVEKGHRARLPPSYT